MKCFLKKSKLLKQVSILLALVILLGANELYVYASEISSVEESVNEEAKILDEDLEYMPGEILVSYQDETSEEKIIQFAQEMDGELTDTVDELQGENIAVINISDEMTVEEAVKKCSENPDIEYAEPNYILHQSQDEISMEAVESGVANQWYLEYTRAMEAWELLSAYNNDRVRVAVIDTGAKLEHEDLSSIINKKLSVEVVRSSNSSAHTDIPLRGDGYLNGTSVRNERTTHGTHVSGIIAAQSGNDVGIQGVASCGDTIKKNNIVDLVVIDAFTEINSKNEDIATVGSVIYAMQYAQDIGCKVVNLSLGTESNSVLLERKCQQLKEAGMTIVCAAGNEGENISTYPSDYSSTIGVINITRQGERSYTSTYGSKKDLSAPGTDIYSTINGGNSAYGMLSGTSMASPVVAAVAAMLLYAEPALSPEQVRSVLCETAVDLNIPGKDDETGYGAINIEAALKKVQELQRPKTPAVWKHNSKGWWYQRSDGSYPRSCWEKIDGYWYNFNKWGYMRTGWYYEKQKWYYLKSSGAMAEGWAYVEGKWYYLTPGSGAMRIGWLKMGGKWYYLNKNGIMHIGWIKLGNNWYYLEGNGVMAEGWIYVGGKWYYLTPGSGVMRTGWYRAGNKWYYSYENGAMAVNTWIGSYYVNASGVWIQ